MAVVPTREVANSNEQRRQDDGFTVARRSGRKPAPVANHVVSGASGSRGNLGRISRDIPMNKERGVIPLANSFGRLVEDIQPPKVKEGIIALEANKENMNLGITTNNGKSLMMATEGEGK